MTQEAAMCQVINCIGDATREVTWGDIHIVSCESHIHKLRQNEGVPDYIDTANYIRPKEKTPVEDISETSEGFYINVECDVDNLKSDELDVLVGLMHHFNEMAQTINNIDGPLKIAVSMTDNLFTKTLEAAAADLAQGDTDD